MNQILVVENKKKKSRTNTRPVEMTNIIRFFGIVLIIFGICFVGQGSYAIYRDFKAKNTDNMPVVKVRRVNDKVILKVNSTNKIENIRYNWNTSEETKVPVEDTFVEEQITLPIENSVLNVVVEEETGRTVKYAKDFIIEGMDITEPKILIEQEGSTGNIKITATDETQMAYITYKVNDEEEVKLYKTELEDKMMQYILKLQKGENKVVITAVDNSGNIATETKTVILSAKTSVNLKIENGKLIVIAEDPDGIRDVDINLNGVVYTAKDINQKGVRIPLELVKGTNTIKLTITNVNSLVTAGVKEFKYE